jgi:preprotein translocase subunit SecE
LYFPAQSANKETTTLLKTNKSIQIDWNLTSIADSAKNTLCTEKQSKGLGGIMAKKKPNNQSSTVNTAQQEPEVKQEVAQAPQKAAVNVDSKNEPKKAKNSAKKSVANEKKPNPFKRFGRWLKGVFSELKKVTWLKGKDVAKNTAVVLVVVVLFFVVLFVIDYVLAGLLGLIVDGKWATIFI